MYEKITHKIKTWYLEVNNELKIEELKISFISSLIFELHIF